MAWPILPSFAVFVPGMPAKRRKRRAARHPRLNVGATESNNYIFPKQLTHSSRERRIKLADLVSISPRIT